MVSTAAVRRLAGEASNARAAWQKSEADKALGPSTSTKLTAATADELDAMAWHEQGDEAMYTPEALRARSKLRRHAEVVGAIRRWWKESPLSGNDTMGKQGYVMPCTNL